MFQLKNDSNLQAFFFQFLKIKVKYFCTSQIEIFYLDF